MMDKKESVLQKILHALFGTKTKKIFGLVIAAVLLISSGVLVYLSSMVKDDAPVDNKDILALKEESTAVDEQVVEELQEEEILEGENLFNEIWAEETDGEVMPEESDGPLATKDNETGNNGSSDDDDSAPAATPTASPEKTKDTYQIYVSKNSYTIAILGLDENGEYTKVVRKFSTGIGRSSSQTRTGTFEITGKQRWHAWSSTSYSPYATKYSGGVYIHGPLYSEKDSNSMKPGSYNAIGTSCSSGCLRTTCSAAAWVYYNCPVGTKVIVANDSKYTSSRPAQIPDSQTYDPTDPGATPEIPITAIALSDKEKTLTVGESFTLSVTSFTPSNTSTKGFLYSSSDNAIATVDASGNVIAIGVGTATITVTADDPYGKSASCKVTVNELATPPPTDTEDPSTPPTDTETPSVPPTDTETPSAPPTDTETPSVPPTDTETPSVPPTDTETPSVPPTDTETPSTQPTDTESTTPVNDPEENT